jgi:DNA-binding transcriptional MocR family regulator
MTDPPKYQEVARTLRWGLQSGDYSPGDLILLDDLTSEFEVTEPTALRALGLLEREDLVVRDGEGWTVADPAVRTPTVVAVTVLAYTVIVCETCGYVWGNSQAMIQRKGFQVDSMVEDHRSRHLSGLIGKGDEGDVR